MNGLSPRYRAALRTGLVILVFASLSIPAFAQPVARGNTVVSQQNGLRRMLQDEGATTLQRLSVNVASGQAAGSYTVYKGVNAQNALIGTVVVVNEAGKEGPLQVLVALRPNGNIYDVGFTVFGEDRGRPALRWGFLRQFIGKSSRSAITIGRDIDGVSGATWTSTSVAAAVKRAALVYANHIN